MLLHPGTQYPLIKKKVIAIVNMLKLFQEYTGNHQVKVILDTSPIVWLEINYWKDAMLRKLRQKLLEGNYQLINELK